MSERNKSSRKSHRSRLKKVLLNNKNRISSVASAFHKLSEKSGSKKTNSSHEPKDRSVEGLKDEPNDEEKAISPERPETDLENSLSIKGNERLKGRTSLSSLSEKSTRSVRSLKSTSSLRTKSDPGSLREKSIRSLKSFRSLKSKKAKRIKSSKGHDRLMRLFDKIKKAKLGENSKDGKSVFTSDKLEQIECFLKTLAINECLNKIEFIEYDQDDTIKYFTTKELIEFEKNLKKKRIELDLYLFTFRHFGESIKQDIVNAIDSIDLISKWITIKDERIQFWSKLNQSVYAQFEIDPTKYELILKDENNNLIKFTKENFHQIVKTFAVKITDYEYLLKSLNSYVDRINEKKQLISLNLVNLFNFRAKKISYKYVNKSAKRKS